jgi:putative membrane protein
MGLLVRLLLTAVSVMIVAYLIPGVAVDGLLSAVIVAVVFGVVNATLGLALKILTFPLSVVTLGLFWFVINALMLLFVSRLVPGFSINGFWAAFLGAILLSVVNTVLKWILPDGSKRPDKR